MGSKIFFILVLFAGQLLPSDKKSENKFPKDIRTIVKKVVVPVGVGIAASVFSHKTASLEADAPVKGDAPHVCCFYGIFGEALLVLSLICANIKFIPFFAVNEKIISLNNGQRICDVISVAHECAAAAAVHYGLKRFFPN